MVGTSNQSVPVAWPLTTEMASNYLQPRYITIVFMGLIMVYNGPSSLVS